VLKKVRTHNDDQKTGVEIVRKALSTPVRQIATNAGEDGSVIAGKILEKDQYAYGFDAQNGEYVNLVSKGCHRLRPAGSSAGHQGWILLSKPQRPHRGLREKFRAFVFREEDLDRTR